MNHRQKTYQTAYQQEQIEESAQEDQREHVSLKKMGFIDKGTGEHQSNQVFSKYGQCPTIPAVSGPKDPLKILDKNE